MSSVTDTLSSPFGGRKQKSPPKSGRELAIVLGLPHSAAPEDPAVMEARRRADIAERNRRGAAGTILTGPTGVGGEPNLGKKTLLGGG